MKNYILSLAAMALFAAPTVAMAEKGRHHPQPVPDNIELFEHGENSGNFGFNIGNNTSNIYIGGKKLPDNVPRVTDQGDEFKSNPYINVVGSINTGSLVAQGLYQNGVKVYSEHDIPVESTDHDTPAEGEEQTNNNYRNVNSQGAQVIVDQGATIGNMIGLGAGLDPANLLDNLSQLMDGLHFDAYATNIGILHFNVGLVPNTEDDTPSYDPDA